MKKLPVKWCIKRTKENASVINSWLNRRRTSFTSSYERADGWVHSDSNQITIYKGNHSSYTELTLGEFTEMVIKGKSIVGYKAPFDIYGGAVRKGTVMTYVPTGSGYYAHTSYHLPKEVVEKWEPVYESLTEIHLVEQNTKEIPIKGGKIFLEDKWHDVEIFAHSMGLGRTLGGSPVLHDVTIVGNTTLTNREIMDIISIAEKQKIK